MCANNPKESLVSPRSDVGETKEYEGGVLPHLRDDSQPGVDGHMGEAFLQGGLHIRGTTMVEPECEQPQDVLKMSPLPHLSCSKTTSNSAVASTVRFC